MFSSFFLLFLSSSSVIPYSSTSSVPPSTFRVGLDFSTFFGGISSDYGSSIAVDTQGNIYVTGSTSSSNFPTKNAFQSVFKGGSSDAFIAKFNSTYQLVFSSFFGGLGDDYGYSVAVDTQGNSYITGSTTSFNYFPTKNAYNSTFGGGKDVFVAKFNSTGNLVFSTLLGGTRDDFGPSIAVDSQGNCYVTGTTLSSNFPTKNAYNSTFGGGEDVFVAKFNSSGNLVSSTYLGGSGNEFGSGIAVDGQGNNYVTGSTTSVDFPTKNAYNSTYGGSNIYGFNLGDAFVTKFNSTGNLVFSTYLGGTSDDFGTSIAVDSQGNSYVTGSTSSSDFPTKDAFQSDFGNSFYGSDVFITKFNSFGTLIFSTYLGGTSSDFGTSIAVDSQGNSYVTGSTSSSDFPTKDAYNFTYCGESDAFVAKFNASGNLVFSIFLGGSNDDYGSGIAIDSQGNSYVTGSTYSNDFPTKIPYDSSYGGILDAFIAKLSLIPFSSSNRLKTPNLTDSIFSNILYIAVLFGFLVIVLIIIVEYRKFVNFKKQFQFESHMSFYKYLASKLTRKSKYSFAPNHISDKVFEILDEIEKENTPKE